jgi:D-alanine--poly(phosphoribitol) ligase subunit 2
MSEAIESQILDYIRAELIDAAGQDTVDPDVNLFTSGLLDSVGVVRLIAHMQTQLDVHVPPPDLVPANFRTVRVMAAYLQGLSQR